MQCTAIKPSICKNVDDKNAYNESKQYLQTKLNSLATCRPFIFSSSEVARKTKITHVTSGCIGTIQTHCSTLCPLSQKSQQFRSCQFCQVLWILWRELETLEWYEVPTTKGYEVLWWRINCTWLVMLGRSFRSKHKDEWLLQNSQHGMQVLLLRGSPTNSGLHFSHWKPYRRQMEVCKMNDMIMAIILQACVHN